MAGVLAASVGKLAAPFVGKLALSAGVLVLSLAALEPPSILPLALLVLTKADALLVVVSSGVAGFSRKAVDSAARSSEEVGCKAAIAKAASLPGLAAELWS